MRPPRARILLASFLALAAVPAPASAFGPYGHGAISLKAAEQLGLGAEEREWFALGGVMGDLDKSDGIATIIQDPFLRLLAAFGSWYSFPALFDLHDPACLAELIEAAGRTGDPRLEAWALGVLSHRRADVTVDTYPDPFYRIDTGVAEVTADVEIFRKVENERFRALFARIEGADEMVYSPRKTIPWTWWFFGRAGSLREGNDHDAGVLAVDPFAALILEAYWAAHPSAASGPRNVSDVWRQQSAFDAFAWNYRFKAIFFPGRAAFLQAKGPGWIPRMESIAFDETVQAIVAETQAWQAHLARLRAGQPSTRPTIP